MLSLPFLLATDGSESAHVAQTWLYAIAGALATMDTAAPAVVVLAVQPTRSRLRASFPRGGSLLAKPTVKEATSEPAITPEQLTRLQAEYPTPFPVDYRWQRGRPTTEILNCARSIGTGLIALGSGTKRTGRDRLLGSVAAVIARYAPCSVLIARQSQPIAGPPLGHLLILLNQVATTQQAIDLLRQLVPAGVHRVTLLRVQLPVNASYLFGPFTNPNPSWQLNQSLQAAQKEQGEHLLQQAKALILEAHPQLEVQTALHIGEAGQVVCEVAQQLSISLIVLTSAGDRQSLLKPLQNLRQPQSPPRPLRNTRLDPTEDYVIHHASRPVLLHRPLVPQAPIHLISGKQ